MHTVSATHALLACALIMGAIAVALASMPFMRLLDGSAESTEAESKATPIPAANLS
jgi:hypothetical protein